MMRAVVNWWRRLMAGLRGAGGSAAPGREAALAVFALDQVDARACRGLREGQEADLRAGDGGEVAVWRKGARLGLAPPQEAGRLRELLARGARLGCRVVRCRPDEANEPVRVRVSILLP